MVYLIAFDPFHVHCDQHGEIWFTLPNTVGHTVGSKALNTDEITKVETESTKRNLDLTAS